MFESKLDAMVREKVERIVNAARYERSGGRKVYRSGHYERSLTDKAGRLELKVPDSKTAPLSLGIPSSSWPAFAAGLRS